jgi:hypothetical protein
VKKWDRDNRQFIFDLCFEESQDFEFCSCTVSKLVERASLKELKNLADFERKILFKQIERECMFKNSN